MEQGSLSRTGTGKICSAGEGTLNFAEGKKRLFIRYLPEIWKRL